MSEDEAGRRICLKSFRIVKFQKYIAFRALRRLRFSPDDHGEKVVTPVMSGLGKGDDEDVVFSRLEVVESFEPSFPVVREARPIHPAQELPRRKGMRRRRRRSFSRSRRRKRSFSPM